MEALDFAENHHWSQIELDRVQIYEKRFQEDEMETGKKKSQHFMLE